MQSPINSILRAATRKSGERLNILTAPTHESYETNLAKTNCEFYSIWTQGIKRWNTSYRKVPQNYHLIADNKIPDDVDFDIVLSQNKFGQFQLLSKLASTLHLPLVVIEHTLPMPNWSRGQLAQLKDMRGDINLFISEYSRGEWGWGEEAEVIHHGIDTELFKPDCNIESGLFIQRQNMTLSVVNDWINRRVICGYDTWVNVTKGLPTIVLGDTPGFSKPAPTVEDLATAYQRSRIFLNTSLISPIPTSLLEAMSAGCACVSTTNCMIPEIIEHGVNGLLSNNERELRGFIQDLMKDEELAKKLGAAARQTILEKFSANSFIDNWNSIFERASNIVYTGDNR